MRNGSLVIAILLVTLVSGLVRTEALTTSPYIPTEGYSWNHSAVDVQIYPASKAWFKTSFTNDTITGIERWTESILVFTDAYGFDYLKELKFNIVVSASNSSNPDVRVSFIQSNPRFVGQTTWSSIGGGFFPKPVMMQLAAYDSSNTTELTDVDMTNIAMHEFGHALGLNHPGRVLTDDNIFELMYATYGYPIGGPTNKLEEPSTLDIYALSQIYSWLPNNPPLFGPAATNIFLPANITYIAMIPYKDQISSLQNYIQSQNLKIIVLASVAGVFFAATIALAILLTRRKPLPPQPVIFSQPPLPPPAPDQSNTT